MRYDHETHFWVLHSFLYKVLLSDVNFGNKLLMTKRNLEVLCFSSKYESSWFNKECKNCILRLPKYVVRIIFYQVILAMLTSASQSKKSVDFSLLKSQIFM